MASKARMLVLERNMKHTHHTDPFEFDEYEVATESRLVQALWLTPGVLFLGWIIISIVTT